MRFAQSCGEPSTLVSPLAANTRCWRASDQRWDLSVWAKNLTDEDAVIFQQGPDAYDIAVSGGSYTQTNTIPERIFGMTARYNF